MEHQPIITRIMLGGWISPIALAVTGELSYFRTLLWEELKKFIGWNFTQPHIIVTDAEHPYNHAAADSLCAKEIDINDETNWIFADRKIMLKTGTTSDGMTTFFELIYFGNAILITQEIIDTAIDNAIFQYQQE